MEDTICRALLLVGVVLTAQSCGSTADVGGGFSVELIHRDSVKSPFHDPSLTAHGRVLAAVRRSTARAAALGRQLLGGSADGGMSEVVPRPYEYLMAVNVGTPRTRMLAIVDTGSDLVWFKCSNGSSTAADPPPSAGAAAFDLSSSSTYGLVGCQTGACHALPGSSCDATNFCKYLLSYPDGSQMAGNLSTETFTFDDAPGGCVGCRDRPQLVVPSVNFGCSSTDTTTAGPAAGFVGLGAGNLSLINQIGAATSLGRRFSYCLAPYSANVSSALNFGSRAAVTEPGAATGAAPLRPSAAGPSYYSVELYFVMIGNSTFSLPYRSSNVVVDSATPLTYLDKGLFDPMVEELTRRINLTRTPSPERSLELCFNVGGARDWALQKVFPDVTLQLGGGAVVTLKPENTFVEVEQGCVCLAMAPVTEELPVAVIGNFAQQNMHVGYDLDKGTVTFAPADCAKSYTSPPASVASLAS